jgi:light-regulated signal transduction histidine kinase (bacteriophytochrome)
MLELEAERLSARVEELEREKAALEAFAAVAAHELVEPLVMTEAYVAIVTDRLNGTVHEDSRRDLATISRAASRMRLLLEAILHDARSNERSVAPRPVDLGAIVAECEQMLGPEIEQRAVRMQVGALPTVSGEEPLLSGLMANLMINALKFSPRHEASIALGSSLEGPVWKVWIDSDGPTIAPEDRARIFEPYQRGHGERRTRGAGLGLTICRRIVERHGGHIGVVPADGGGNRFYFTLPAG